MNGMLQHFLMIASVFVVGLITYMSIADMLRDLTEEIESLHEKIDKFTAEKKEEGK